MKKVIFLLVIGTAFLFVGIADAGDLYVDDDGYADAISCDSLLTSAYTHPQDAVNAAGTGDTILVCPGAYGSRNYPNGGCNDTYAPALIVYKDDLTIQATGTAAETIIESTHQCWSNASAVLKSTDDNVDSNAAPNGVSVIASGVTIEGFTLRSEYEGDPWKSDPNCTSNCSDWPNTAGIMIGALYAGDQNNLGVTDTTVKDCIIFGHSGVYNWRSTDTTIEGNSVTVIPESPYPKTHNGNGIAVWDGWFEGTYPPTSTGVQILNNNIDTCNVVLDHGIFLNDEGKGIMFGGTDSTSAWDDFSNANGADQSGMLIDGNTICAASTGIKFWNSVGDAEIKLITCDNTITFGDGYYRVHDYGSDEDYPPSTWTDPYPDCQECEGDEVALCAGQTNDIGTVTVTNDDEYLYVTFSIEEEGWYLDETHVAVGNNVEAIPHTKKGNPIPGQFPYSCDLDTIQTSCTVEISLGDWCFESDIVVAAHAAVVSGIIGDGCETEVFWATNVVDWMQGTLRNGNPVSDPKRTNPVEALAAPNWIEGSSINFYSLGFDLDKNAPPVLGWLTVGFGYPIYNGPGDDIVVQEVTNGRNGYPEEIAQVFGVNGGTDYYAGDVSNKDGGTGLGRVDLPAGMTTFDFVKLLDATDPAEFDSRLTADAYDVDAVGACYLFLGDEEETAWGNGCDERYRFVDKGNWGTYIEYTINDCAECD